MLDIVLMIFVSACKSSLLDSLQVLDPTNHLRFFNLSYLNHDGITLPRAVDENALRDSDPRKPKKKDPWDHDPDDDWEEEAASDCPVEWVESNSSGSSDDKVLAPQITLKQTKLYCTLENRLAVRHLPCLESLQHRPPTFAVLEFEIEKAIQASTTGAVFPKLNWTCPRDAIWMTSDKSLKCSSAGEVFLLLKASDFVHHDLDLCKKTQTPPVLLLKKWIHLNDAYEFRCFIRHGRLLFACQRDAARYFDFLIEDQFLQNKLLDLMNDFVCSVLVPGFNSMSPDGGFVADVYVELTQRKPEGKVWLMDLAPLPVRAPARVVGACDLDEKALHAASEEILSVPPHPLLTWSQLFAEENGNAPTWDPRLIIVESKAQADFSEFKALSMHRVPLDLVHGHMSASTMEEGLKRLAEQASGRKREESL